MPILCHPFFSPAENTKVSFTSNDSGYFYWSENGEGGKALTLDYVKL